MKSIRSPLTETGSGTAGREGVKLIVIMPVGPTSSPEFVLDTLQSVAHYSSPSTRIVVIDDTGADMGAVLQRRFPSLIVLQSSGATGLHGALFDLLRQAYLYIHQHFDFQVMLKLDTDALMIGERPEDDAIRYFEENPEVGLAGSYRVDCNGDLRDFAWAARQLYHETATRRGLFQDPRRFVTLRRLLLQALANGYLPGEHVQGGAYFWSAKVVHGLAQAGLLDHKELRTSNLAEEQIAALLVRALGMRLGDLATGGLPMGIRWRGLPCSPLELVQRGKKVVHSVRFWQDMPEGEIREFFRRRRTDG